MKRDMKATYFAEYNPRLNELMLDGTLELDKFRAGMSHEKRKVLAIAAVLRDGAKRIRRKEYIHAVMGADIVKKYFNLPNGPYGKFPKNMTFDDVAEGLEMMSDELKNYQTKPRESLPDLVDMCASANRVVMGYDFNLRLPRYLAA